MGKPFGSVKQTGGSAGGQAADQGFTNFLSNGINQGVFGGGNFGDAINSMLQGRPGDPNSLNQYFDQINGGGNGGLAQGQFMTPSGYAPPQYQGFNPQDGGNGMVGNLPNATSNYNPGQINGQFTAPNMQGIQLSDAGANNSLYKNAFGTTANLADAGSANMDGQFGAAVRQNLNTDLQHQVGDLRARYGATGSGLGSNAQFAESNLRAQAAPQIAAAMGNINQQERGLNLEQRGQDLQNFLGGRNADVSQMGQLTNAFGGNNQAILGNNSQNSNNSQFGAQLGFNAANANQQNQLSAAAQQLQAQGINISALMQNQGMGNQMNQFNNQLGQNQNQFMNQFGQQNSQFGAQFGQSADQFNSNAMLQNQQMMNQYGLGKAGIGNQQMQMQQQAQQAAIQQLMQAFMGNQQLNTAQRQNQYQPGYVEQGMGLLSQGAGIASKFMNPFGGMGGQLSPQIPQFQTPSNGGNMMNTSFGQYPSYGGGLFGGQQGMNFNPNMVANQGTFNPLSYQPQTQMPQFGSGLTPNQQNMFGQLNDPRYGSGPSMAYPGQFQQAGQFNPMVLR